MTPADLIAALERATPDELRRILALVGGVGVVPGMLPPAPFLLPDPLPSRFPARPCGGPFARGDGRS